MQEKRRRTDRVVNADCGQAPLAGFGQPGLQQRAHPRGLERHACAAARDVTTQRRPLHLDLPSRNVHDAALSVGNVNRLDGPEDFHIIKTASHASAAAISRP